MPQFTRYVKSSQNSSKVIYHTRSDSADADPGCLLTIFYYHLGLWVNGVQDLLNCDAELLFWDRLFEKCELA